MLVCHQKNLAIVMGPLKRTSGAAHAGHATHAAELREVLLGGLVLLVLINPLVEVGLEEVKSLVLLEESWPVLLLEVLLLELDLDVLGSVVDLALGRVNLGVEFELDVVLALQGARCTGEGQGGGLEVQLQVILGYVRDGDGQVDEVLGGVRVGGALSPEDCRAVSACSAVASLLFERDVLSELDVVASLVLGAKSEASPRSEKLFVRSHVPSGVAVSAIMIVVCWGGEEIKKEKKR